jgi:hypothetical protein
MKRFEVFYKNKNLNNHLMENGEIFANEVRFVIIAKSKNRAIELIENNNYNSNHFLLEETSNVKNQLGKYFEESIRDGRI